LSSKSSVHWASISPQLFLRAVTFWLVLQVGCSPNGARSQQPRPHEGPPTASQNGTTQRPAFDGERAYRLLQKQCDFGPRPVGSDAHKKTRDFLLSEMAKYADNTIAQDFTYRGMTLTNVIGVFNRQAKRRVLLCAHWDTRPTADEELDVEKRRQPILGANDGASGVAILLELARLFREKKPSVGVIIVLFDGEDYGDFTQDEGVFLGSRHFAKNHNGYALEFGILLDMVGDRDLNIYREANSDTYARHINDKVFRIAQELGHGKHIIDQAGRNILDDHIPLNEAGIPTVNLIDFDYGPWHTLEDTPDKCSAASLAIVGNTVAELIYREPGS
jgi:glutaminyl-peptide cyclotransferase